MVTGRVIGVVALVSVEYGYEHWWIKIEGARALDRWDAFWASPVHEGRLAELEAIASSFEQISAEHFADLLEIGAFTHEAHIHEAGDSWMRAVGDEGARPGRRVCCPAAG